MLRWVLLVAVLVVAGFFLGPKTAQALHLVHHFSDVHSRWLVVAVLAEVGSLLAFSLVTWHLVVPPVRPKLYRVLRLDLVTVALSHAVPAGSAAGAALGLQLLREEGVDGVQAGFVKVCQSLLSCVLLETLFSVTLVLQMIIYGPTAENLGLAGAGAALVVLIAVLWYMLARRPTVVSRTAQPVFGWIPRLSRRRIATIVDSLSHHMAALLRRPVLLARISVWSLANWGFDLLALWAALAAFGHTPDLVLLSIAFCVAQVAATIPISPGGLGVVESSMVPLLVGFGTAPSVAVLGVLCWRVVTYWLPLPIGGVAYLGIAVERRRRGSPTRQNAPARSEPETSPDRELVKAP
jgi:uncharacterized protein (TIRG00374 family)